MAAHFSGSMGMRFGATLAVAGVLLAATALGCSTYVDRANFAYRDGRYLEAAEDLAVREHQVHALEPHAQAQYGLYRGLSLLQLNDLSGARQWLGFSSDVERRAPGSLNPNERLALDNGLTKLGSLFPDGSRSGLR